MNLLPCFPSCLLCSVVFSVFLVALALNSDFGSGPSKCREQHIVHTTAQQHANGWSSASTLCPPPPPSAPTLYSRARVHLSHTVNRFARSVLCMPATSDNPIENEKSFLIDFTEAAKKTFATRRKRDECRGGVRCDGSNRFESAPSNTGGGGHTRLRGGETPTLKLRARLRTNASYLSNVYTLCTCYAGIASVRGV